MNISELIGKPLISLAESKREGVVKNAIFDGKLKKVLYLTLFNEQTDTESVVSVPALLSTDGDALTTKFTDDVLPRHSLALEENNPVLAEVFNTAGRLLGTLTDIELDGKLGVTALYINQARTKQEPLSFSATVVVLEGEKKVKLTRAPIKKPTQRNRTARILPILEAEPTASVTIIASEAKASEAEVGQEMVFNGKAPQDFMPQRIIGNYEFLLGRTVAESIKNQRGDVIVEKDTVITESTVETARRHGRLIELTLQSVV